jgi:transcriptional regulator with XRE-family HTH domain
MKIGEACKALRKELGLSQPKMAEMLVLSVASLAHFETGARKPDAESRARLTKAAMDARRYDLADIFVKDLPGVREGVLIPWWHVHLHTPKIATTLTADIPEKLTLEPAGPFFTPSPLPARLRGRGRKKN